MSFRRVLRPFDATMVVIGGIIGSGIFINPRLVAASLDSTWLVLAAWVTGGLVGLCGAFAYAELGARFPRAHGLGSERGKRARRHRHQGRTRLHHGRVDRKGKITISGSQGKVVATAVDASALNGNITNTGTLADSGRYNFVTHNGNIRLGTQANPNATFYVRTYEGSFSHGGVNLKPQGEPRRGRRKTCGGNGSAQVESFNGSLRMFLAGL